MPDETFQLKTALSIALETIDGLLKAEPKQRGDDFDPHTQSHFIYAQNKLCHIEAVLQENAALMH
jgi:hypothetical protein